MIDIPKTDARKSFVEPIPAWGKEESGAVYIRCKCGKCIDLGAHVVADDGTVSPSIWHKGDDCDWHVWGRLIDWEPEVEDANE